VSTPAPKQRSSFGAKLRANGPSILKLVAACVGLFFLGYAAAVYVLFPPLAAPEDGIVVPDLTKMTTSAAGDLLTPLGLALGDSVRLPHASVGPGLIVAQDPLPGQQMRNGGTVRVGVSSGLPAATVPDLVGLGARRAQTLLERLGFEVSQSLENSDRPNGTVIRSTPEAGIRQPLPAHVSLVISSGPAPDTIRIDTIARDTIHATTRN
jgi:eukaryotic-like serine/threonine-protein kinase